MNSGKLRRICINLLQYAIGIGALVWLFHTGTIDPKIVEKLLSAPAWILPTAACFCFINFGFSAWRLRVLMQAQDLRLPFFAAYRLAITAIFFGWIIPGGTGGDLVKMIFLGRWFPGKITEAVTITLWDRAIGLATFFMLGLIAAGFMPSLATSNKDIAHLLIICAAALATGGIVLALALYTDWSQRWPLVLLERFSRANETIQDKRNGSEAVFSRFQRFRTKFVSLLRLLGETILRMFRIVYIYRRHPSSLIGAVILSMCAQVCLIGAALTLATVVVDGGVKPVMLVVLPIGWVTNALPVSPGGVGVGEAAMNKLFSLVGLPNGGDTVLSWRFVAMVTSLPGLWFYFRNRSLTTKQ